MTVILVLSDCPPRLRGDMTKWFVEINTGVYVGNVSARVRDEIWDRVTENLGRGHATMVFSAAGEQHMDFRVHNACWRPIDFDGIKLMRRPDTLNRPAASDGVKACFSKASKRIFASGNKKVINGINNFRAANYAVLDFETTGLDAKSDEIIEIGAIYVEDGIAAEKLQMLVRCDVPVPTDVTQLNGITDAELKEKGVDLAEAIHVLLEFVEDLPLVSHNAAFEQGFLYSACKKTGEEPPENRFIDTLKMSQIILPDLENHKLSTLAARLGISDTVTHRAMADCEITYGIYCKLNELAASETQK